MAEPFDPYYRWLGIPPKDQPPNHYRLLGLERFESNADAIEAAADQRMAHLRTHQTGPHADASQKLLNEVAAAKLTLPSPAKKQAYDEQLASEANVRAEGRASPTLPGVAPAQAAPGSPSMPEFAPAAVHPGSQLSRRGRQNPPWLVPVAIIVGLLLVGGLLAMLLSGDGAPEVAQEGEEGEVGLPALPAPPPAPPEPPTEVEPGPETPQHPRDPEQRPPPEPGLEPGEPPPEEPTGPEDLPTPAEPGEPPPDPGPIELPVEPLPGPDQPQVDPVDPMAGDLSPEPEPTGKMPIPSQAEQDEALALIREVFKEDYDQAKTAPQRAALARKMLDQANQPGTKPTSRFVLLRVAKDVAAEAGDVETAFEAIEQMAAGYDVDALAGEHRAFLRAASGALLPEHRKAIVEHAVPLIREAVGADDYAAAERLGDAASAAARGIRDAEAVRELTALIKEVKRLERAHEAVGPALAALRENPDDPEANLAVGQFLCLEKGDWGKGLPMLARGSDAELAAVAQKDLGSPGSAGEQAALAGAWWDLAQSADGREKNAMLLRAGTWYQAAAPKLTGLQQQVAKKRLQEVAEIGGTLPFGLAAEIQPGGRLPRGQWIDLLGWIDTGLDVVEGNWSSNGDALRTIRPVTNARVMLPVRLNGSYEIAVDFTRTSGGGAVAFVLPVGSHQCLAKLNGWVKGTTYHGIEWIDGRSAKGNQTTVRPGDLPNGKRHLFLVQVKTQGDTATVVMFFDGRHVTAWSGKRASLSVPAHEAMPEWDRPGLEASGNMVIVHGVRLRPVDGEATRPTSP